MRVHELVAALQHLPADAVVHQVVVEPAGVFYDRVAGVVQTVDVALDEFARVVEVWLVAPGGRPLAAPGAVSRARRAGGGFKGGV